MGSIFELGFSKFYPLAMRLDFLRFYINTDSSENSVSSLDDVFA